MDLYSIGIGIYCIAYFLVKVIKDDIDNCFYDMTLDIADFAAFGVCVLLEMLLVYLDGILNFLKFIHQSYPIKQFISLVHNPENVATLSGFTLPLRSTSSISKKP